MNTSGRTNPKPDTFVNVGSRGSDFIFIPVGTHRVKSASGKWLVYVAEHPMRNGKPMAEVAWILLGKFGSKALATAAVDEHRATGKVSDRPVSLAERVALCEHRIAVLEGSE